MSSPSLTRVTHVALLDSGNSRGQNPRDLMESALNSSLPAAQFQIGAFTSGFLVKTFLSCLIFCLSVPKVIRREAQTFIFGAGCPVFAGSWVSLAWILLQCSHSSPLQLIFKVLELLSTDQESLKLILERFFLTRKSFLHCVFCCFVGASLCSAAHHGA